MGRSMTGPWSVSAMARGVRVRSGSTGLSLMLSHESLQAGDIYS